MNDDPHRPLRDDVRHLGALLGDTLKEQVGQSLFDNVEAVRHMSRDARADSTPEYQPISDFLSTLTLDEASDVARAFAQFLNLANIAEQHHRVRRRRHYDRVPGSAPQPGSFADTLRGLVARGIPASEIRDAVAALEVELVLTAHPTQVTRRTILQKYDRVEAALDRGDRVDLTVREAAANEAELRRVIAELWETEEVRRERPTPLEEVRGGLVVFERTLWDVVPAVLRSLDESLREVTGEGLAVDAAPIRFGSWMGGDRDGNPFVTPEVTRKAVLLARWMAAHLFAVELDRLRDELSMARSTPALEALAGTSHEPYRALLRDARERFRETLIEVETLLRGEAPPAGLRPWREADELRSVLDACDTALRETGNARLADGRLLDVRRRLSCFGLTIVRLDVRQESTRHTAALDAITRAVGLGAYSEWDEAARVAFLERELANPRPLLPRKLVATDEVLDVFGTFEAIAEIGSEALGAYVISMASAASDVLGVALLQKEFGVERPLRVAPLFETEADLLGAADALRRLFAVEPYRARIGDRQEVMIGYSDSAKDAGRLASAWRLYTAQEEIVRACAESGVEPTLFHGRGGTVGRGGGPTWLAIRSQPPGSVRNRLRVTVQGEMIDAHFGITGVAERTLEVYLMATLDTSVGLQEAPPKAWRDAVERLAVDSAEAYRSVVREDPRFVDYFRAATPEQELGHLNVGSRPARRGGKKGGVESLRAIPWVFAWTQTRLNLPSWLGVGAALTRSLERGERSMLRQMYADWPFFRSTIDLVQMVLAKASPEVAGYYDSALVPDELRPLGTSLRDALAATKAAILEVTEQDVLLADNPVLRRSIAVRNPYVDPINLVQVDLLRRYRQDPDNDDVLGALLVTVNGIAAGMRNTG
jgi:phosphoenolpyruvate carboxylase